MKANRRILRSTLALAGLAALVLGIAVVQPGASAERAQAANAPARQSVQKDQPAKDLKLSGPYTHKNLAIFLIHGPDRIKDKEFLTLQEALDGKKIIVHETGDVNVLVVESKATVAIYIQSGEIVKGGKQDRVLPHDVILPPRCPKTSISAFCVEQGRWRQRGGENLAAFSESTNAVAGKELKLAAKLKDNQGEVWKQVANQQGKLSANAGVNVQALESSSSMELTLSDKKVQEAAEEYVKELSKAVEGKKDVVGFAFAINGKVNSADVYASSALFAKLWPKLIKTSSIEAVAELQKDKQFQAVSADDVKGFLADAEKGKESEKQVVKDVKMDVRESDKNVMFRTRAAGAVKDFDDVHTNYVSKQ